GGRERAMSRAMHEDLAQQELLVSSTHDVGVGTLIGGDDQAVAGGVDGQDRHGEVAVERDVPLEIGGGSRVRLDSRSSIQSVEVLLEVEPGLRVERLHLSPVGRRGELCRVVDASVPRRVASGAMLELRAIAKREAEVDA